jgi:hypothetical protein
MSRRRGIAGLIVAVAVMTLLAGQWPTAGSAAAPGAVTGAPYSPAWLAANHGRFDNRWTAAYEAQALALPAGYAASGALAPLYGADVRMTGGGLGSGQNGFQIAINPLDSRFAVAGSNDGGAAGVGLFRTTDRGATWTSRDAPIGVSACCNPSVAYAWDGAVYAGVLGAGVDYVIRSTDNGGSWGQASQMATPDRPSLVIDNGPGSPRRGVVYVVYSDVGSPPAATNRIKAYRSTDAGRTWGASFFVGATPPPLGYEQAAQAVIAGDGALYVGYQQYLNASVGCSGGVQNVLARSTDGGATFRYTTLDIVQGGACSASQSGRGIFCVNAAGVNFRSRSQPIIGVSPTNPDHVYMLYAGGDLETAYTCAGSTGRHSDTLFRLSTDAGLTFSDPARVNGDVAGKDQYLPWMDVAPDGTIWAGWNDRREDAANFLSRWYQASSTDEGATWAESPVADARTQPGATMGDFSGLAAGPGLTLGVWFDSRNAPNGDPYTDPEGAAGATATPPSAVSATATRTPAPTATRPPTASASRTATASATAPLSATPTPTSADPCPSATRDGALTVDDPTQAGRIGLDGVASACAAPKPPRTLVDTAPRHYDAYTFVNTSPDPQCVTATLDPGACIGTRNIVTVAYADSFDPTDPRAHYLADPGLAPGPGPISYSFLVAAGQTYVIVVAEANGGSGCPGYHLTVQCAGPATATPTVTPPRTPSPTATPMPSAPPTSTLPPSATRIASPSPKPEPSLTATSAPPSRTPTAEPTPRASPTEPRQPSPSVTPAPPTATETPCEVAFADVGPADYFYTPVQYLACHGVIAGYADGSFRPYNPTTRGQMVKMVVGAFHTPGYLPPNGATFADTPPDSPFFPYVEAAAQAGVVSGYSCGAPDEPCDSQARPYFRPNAEVTRGQLAKIIAVAAAWTLISPTSRTFEDVARTSPFYVFVETAYCHGVVSGYACGTPAEPCGAPISRPYFRPGASATRGQIAKIVRGALLAPVCGVTE